MGLLEKLMKPMIEKTAEATAKHIGELSENLNSEVNKVGEIVGQSPDSYNSQIFNLAKQINKDIVIPIAVIVITFIAIYSLVNLVIDKNNLHDIDTFIFFKWIFITYISIWFVTHSFDLVMAIFSICQKMIAGVTNVGVASTDISSQLDSIKESLKELNILELGYLYGTVRLYSITSKLIGILTWIVALGRMIEIYFTIAVSSLPLATMTSNRYSNVGDGYIKQVIALGLQGLFMIMAVATYSVLIQGISYDSLTAGDVALIPLNILGYGFLLLIVQKKKKSIARSIVGI